MKLLPFLLLAASMLLAPPGFATDTHGAPVAANQNVAILTFLNEISAENNAYMTSHKIEFFAGLAKGQTPRATVVTCSDSRVQANMFDRSPEGELFTVRNIGNQLVTAEGSVEYGVHHLHTPILLFIGHSRCGAIAAVSGNYSKESVAIKRELDSITIPKELNNLDGVKANVNFQVSLALLKFSDEIESGQLTVIGAVMDFADDLHQGAGKLHLINVNGETDATKLKNVSLLLTSKKAKSTPNPLPKKSEHHENTKPAEPAHH